MDTIVSLSPPLLRLRMSHSHHPHASSSASTTASRHLPPAAPASSSSSSSPRLLIKQQRSSSIIGNNHSSPTRPRSLLLSPRASASTATVPAAPAQKEKDLVFVAGATGRVGSRTVRELIKLGFRVRAAVRNTQRATSLVQSVQQLKLADGDGDAAAETTQLELVECDLEKQAQEGIVSAIGNASLVVCSIGASEKEILDVTGPYRIDYMATNKLVQAASAANVEHFILVTSLGTNKIGFPAFLLNLFWGVLYWKRRAEEALIASGIPYTIVRPGGMERPTDAFKETHNLVLAPEDTYVGGQVSNLQVAELIGCIMATNSNRRAAYCKIVEAVAETTAPLLPMEQLLSTIPSKREPPAADDEPPEDETEAAEVKASDPKQPEPPAPAAVIRDKNRRKSSRANTVTLHGIGGLEEVTKLAAFASVFFLAIRFLLYWAPIQWHLPRRQHQTNASYHRPITRSNSAHFHPTQGTRTLIRKPPEQAHQPRLRPNHR